MVVYLVCFDLSATPQAQREQVSFWLQFLNSSIPNLPQLYSPGGDGNNSDNKNWRVMVVGLRSDLKRETILTTEIIQNWQSLMPNLPLFHHQLFEVSSLHIQQSIRELLNSVSLVCSQIFEKHAMLIPSSFRKLLGSIKDISTSSNNIPHPLLSFSTGSSPSISSSLGVSQSDSGTTNTILLPFQQLHQFLQHECGMDLASFKNALHYFHSIGHIVFLQNGMVCTAPTMIPKLLSKFISPTDIQNRLLSENPNVQILNQKEIGSILQINACNNPR